MTEQIDNDKIELIKRLVIAERNFKPIKRTKTGQVGNQKYKYAPLDEVIKATKPALNEQDIKAIFACRYYPQTDVSTLVLELHYGLAIIYSELKIPEPGQEGKGSKEQKFGTTLTYWERYIYCGMLCIASEDDTDAQGGNSSRGAPPQRRDDKKDTNSKTSTPQQKAFFKALQAQFPGNTGIGKEILAEFGLKSSDELTPENIVNVLKAIIAKKEDMDTQV